MNIENFNEKYDREYTEQEKEKFIAILRYFLKELERLEF